MNISELIAKLEIIKKEHGDLEVKTSWPYNGDVRSIVDPKVDHMAILKGRERFSRFASYFEFEGDYEKRKGEKVCKL